jgi:hypothetical protein
MEFQEADAEAPPFRDAGFDAVLSTFGVMFTPGRRPIAGAVGHPGAHPGAFG